MKPANWILIASLYVTQFLPVSFFFMGLPAILREQGRTLEEIGALYLLGFVWVFKILWAPLVDRVSFSRLGHYRGWLLAMQAAMIAMLVVIGQIDGLANFPLLVVRPGAHRLLGDAGHRDGRHHLPPPASGAARPRQQRAGGRRPCRHRAWRWSDARALPDDRLGRLLPSDGRRAGRLLRADPLLPGTAGPGPRVWRRLWPHLARLGASGRGRAWRAGRR